MNIASPSADFWNAYGLQFRHDSHFLVVEGFRRAPTVIRQQSEETAITGCIVEGVQEFLAETEDEKFERYAVKEDNPQPGEDRLGKHRRRVDILVERTQRLRPKYTFEAKRLESRNHRIGTYTGVPLWQKNQELDGMMRFINGTTYAAGAPEAGFIGYIQSDNVMFWHDALQNSLNSESDLCNLQGLDICPDHPNPNSWSSVHRKNSSESITLFHLFFDCQSPTTDK